MLRLLYPLFEAGLGGPLGDGTGWQPWIEIDDLLYIYLRAVTDPALAGPVNAVAPARCATPSTRAPSAGCSAGPR